MIEGPDPEIGAFFTCARGELNRETTTLDHARTAVLSVKPASRCLRFPPVPSGPCTPGVHQPYAVQPTSAGATMVVDDHRGRLTSVTCCSRSKTPTECPHMPMSGRLTSEAWETPDVVAAVHFYATATDQEHLLDSLENPMR
ncbi:hypothetical protein GCM10007231_06270 [Nocardioides daphniae]|uniref:Uncharacterized protein n=1 Tax=Nocardioides daphniae TaxID=402297 RepID=A0ABQ1Q2H6_9ACTN|nr:hypothetical protein GCM10007231_06270 [Nocardioides daphniae]